MRIRDGGDGDRVRSRAWRPGRAEPVVVAVVAGGDHGHDAGEGRVVNGFVHRVVRRVGLGPPPEKLITFIPSATAASNALTISGVSAS